MARQTAKFDVKIQSLSGTRTVKVAVGTTVAQFKSANDISSSAKVFDEMGNELRNTSILTSPTVTIAVAKKNG